MPASLGEKPNREKVPQTFQYGPINPHSKAHQERRVPGSILTSPLVPYLQYDIAPPLGKRSSRRSRYLTVGRAFRTSSKPKGQINRRVHERARTIKVFGDIQIRKMRNFTVPIANLGVVGTPFCNHSNNFRGNRLSAISFQFEVIKTSSSPS